MRRALRLRATNPLTGSPGALRRRSRRHTERRYDHPLPVVLPTGLCGRVARQAARFPSQPSFSPAEESARTHSRAAYQSGGGCRRVTGTVVAARGGLDSSKTSGPEVSAGRGA